MLLPDDIHPEDTVYFNGAFVLQALQENPSQDFIDLYQQVKRSRHMSMPLFVLCLDWLFLLNAITMNNKGKVDLCS